MCLLLHCLIKRHRRYSNAAGRNDSILSRSTITIRRKPQCRRISFQFMIAMVLLTFFIASVYKITVLQNRAPSPLIPHLFWYSNNHQNKLQSTSLNTLWSDTSNVTLQSVNAIVNTNISSVDYMACCGAGHRISKMADAYYLAKRLKFTLRGYWGYCDTAETTGHLTEVFQYVLPFPFISPLTQLRIL
jgi:hypothetical protein